MSSSIASWVKSSVATSSLMVGESVRSGMVSSSFQLLARPGGRSLRLPGY